MPAIPHSMPGDGDADVCRCLSCRGLASAVPLSDPSPLLRGPAQDETRVDPVDRLSQAAIEGRIANLGERR